MKYCPNLDCPHLLDTGSQVEFLNEIQVYSDCSMRLKWGEASEAVDKGGLEVEKIEVMSLNENNAKVQFLCSCGYGEITLVVREWAAPVACEILQDDYSQVVPDDISGPIGNI